MEKKRATNGKFKTFLKKNIYYIIMAVCLLAIAAMITVTLVTRNNKVVEDPGYNVGPGSEDQDNHGTLNPDDGSNDNPPVSGGEDITPPPVNIVFACPVNDVNILRDYVMDTVVWHNTLRHYAVHNGIDFGGNDGDAVMSAYAGVVTDISYDVLNGYKVTIKHNDSLTTTYSSLNEPTVVVGQTLTKGAVIGTMGITATNEYLDGAHVHFCLYENGKIANPYNYLTLGDK